MRRKKRPDACLLARVLFFLGILYAVVGSGIVTDIAADVGIGIGIGIGMDIGVGIDAGIGIEIDVGSVLHQCRYRCSISIYYVGMEIGGGTDIGVGIDGSIGMTIDIDVGIGIGIDDTGGVGSVWCHSCGIDVRFRYDRYFTSVWKSALVRHNEYGAGEFI